MSDVEKKNRAPIEGKDAARAVTLRNEIIERLEALADICTRTAGASVGDAVLKFSASASPLARDGGTDIEVVCTSDGSFCMSVDFRKTPPEVTWPGQP
jgi:hypothetical protein